MLYLILRIILIAAVAYLLIKTVKPIRILLTVVLALVYIPLNNFQTKVQKWYFSQKKKDPTMYNLFTPFYWIIVAITFIVSVPYEFVIAMDLH
jgi:hypothetical protein